MCNSERFEDINENNNNNGLHCENKCSFEKEKEKEKEKEGTDNTKWNRKSKFIIIFSISFSWSFFIILDFILICKFSILFACSGVLGIIAMILCVILFSPIFFLFLAIYICCRTYDDRDSTYSQTKSDSNYCADSQININDDLIEPSLPIKKVPTIPENWDEKEKKGNIIQTHTDFCDIKEIDNNLYLVNEKEINISFLICHSLKKISKNIVIYTFNIAQVNLFKEKFKDELSFIKIVLLNKTCTNFEHADYIIISYIDSEISQESKKKYPNFKSNLNSRKFYTEKFTHWILETYTRSKLYIICNDKYLKQSNKEETPKGLKKKEIQVPNIPRDLVSNEYNVCFIIDNTGSMGSWINVIKEICNNLFVEIVSKFSKYEFSFGCVLYADKISINTDQNYKINFTKDENEFRSKLEKIKTQNGGDIAEDWVSGFQIALDELSWGNGTKLIFHIADAPHHGAIFNTDKKNDKFLYEKDDINGKKLIKLIEKCSKRNIKIIGISIDKVCSFQVFKREYEKLNGPNYEIIEVNGTELIKGNDFINKKILGIIEKSLDENKADESKIIK